MVNERMLRLCTMSWTRTKKLRQIHFEQDHFYNCGNEFSQSDKLQTDNFPDIQQFSICCLHIEQLLTLEELTNVQPTLAALPSLNPSNRPFMLRCVVEQLCFVFNLLDQLRLGLRHYQLNGSQQRKEPMVIHLQQMAIEHLMGFPFEPIWVCGREELKESNNGSDLHANLEHLDYWLAMNGKKLADAKRNQQTKRSPLPWKQLQDVFDRRKNRLSEELHHLTQKVDEMLKDAKQFEQQRSELCDSKRKMKEIVQFGKSLVRKNFIEIKNWEKTQKNNKNRVVWSRAEDDSTENYL